MKFKEILRSLLRLLIYCTFTISIEILFCFLRQTEIKSTKIIGAIIFGFLYWVLILVSIKLNKNIFIIKNKKED
jgi:hypothetical protein